LYTLLNTPYQFPPINNAFANGTHFYKVRFPTH
jgi:hypothetical protein